MIIINITGPSGSGKTRIANEIIQWCERNNKTWMHDEENTKTKEEIEKRKPDVLIKITKSVY